MHLNFTLEISFPLPNELSQVDKKQLLPLQYVDFCQNGWLAFKIKIVPMVCLVGLVPTRVSVRNLIKGHNLCT